MIAQEFIMGFSGAREYIGICLITDDLNGKALYNGNTVKWCKTKLGKLTTGTNISWCLILQPLLMHVIFTYMRSPKNFSGAANVR